MISYRFPSNSYFPKMGVSHDSFFYSIPRQRKLPVRENVPRSYKKKYKHKNMNKYRRKKGVRTYSLFVSPSCHSEESLKRAAQDLIHEKIVVPVSTNTYCVPTRKKEYSTFESHEKIKNHAHKHRLSKGDPYEYKIVRASHTCMCLTLIHAILKKKKRYLIIRTESIKNR